MTVYYTDLARLGGVINTFRLSVTGIRVLLIIHVSKRLLKLEKCQFEQLICLNVLGA